MTAVWLAKTQFQYVVGVCFPFIAFCKPSLFIILYQKYVFKYLEEVSQGKSKRSVSDELDLLFPQFTGNVPTMMEMWKWKKNTEPVGKISCLVCFLSRQKIMFDPGLNASIHLHCKYTVPI